MINSIRIITMHQWCIHDCPEAGGGEARDSLEQPLNMFFHGEKSKDLSYCITK